MMPKNQDELEALERRSREKQREALGPERFDAIEKIISLSDEEGARIARGVEEADNG